MDAVVITLYSFEKRFAIANPIPLLAPVISIVFINYAFQKFLSVS